VPARSGGRGDDLGAHGTDGDQRHQPHGRLAGGLVPGGVPGVGALVDGELVSENDLRYPWKEPWYYRRTAQGFVLLPPLD
jgi:hypothetical protein